MLLFATLLAAKTASAAGTSGRILASWQTLMAEGCNMQRSHVNTPLEARVLRNVPFAREGYAFKTRTLTQIFQGDGGWYRPIEGKTVTLSATEQACVDTLKARETALRAAQPMSEVADEWLLAHADLYLTLRSYTGPLKLQSAPREVEIGSGCFADGKGGQRWVWLDAACPSTRAECSGVLFECNADCACTSGVGG
jgi:hypothetical protein